ncbi:MAG TPA: phage recombination protein Bet [Nitrososphaeraceae archaeon]
MSNEIVKHEAREISPSSHFTPEQIETIKSIYCKGASDDEFKVFLYTCQRTGLDPFARQVYYIKRGNQMTIQTSIDGYRLVADRTGRYAPGQEPSFVHDAHGKLLSATAYIKKRTSDGTWHIVPATAHFEEYVQVFQGKPSGLWQKMPRTMLAKCAEALAIRKAFPAELSGIYTKEEMDQADSVEVEVVKSIEYITKEQADELTRIISECDPSKLDVMLEHVRKKCNGGDITQLPAKCYPKMRELFEDRRLQYLTQQIDAKMNGDEDASE